MKIRTSFLIIVCIFFLAILTIGANYASDVSDNLDNNTKSNPNGQLAVDNLVDGNTVTFQESVSNNSLSSQDNSKSKYGLILASGEEDKPSKLSQESILDASKEVNTYISKKGKLPNYVTIAKYKFSMPEFMYLLAKTVQYKYKKSNSQVAIKYDINNPTKPTGTNINGKISSKNYHDYATRVAKYMSKEYFAPNYVTVPLGKMQYQSAIYSFIKILIGIENNKLPSSISLNFKKNSKLNNDLPNYARPDNLNSKALNDKYESESLEKYLVATKHCQVDDDAIQSLAIELTKKYKTTLQKAKAIFNWVRDNVEYAFYYNTKNGAKTTLSKKVGNCVDQTHLLIALSRAAGIPARYVNGECKFTSGSTYGHVWAQILIGDTWTTADATNTKNSFGVIKNWGSYKIYGKYAEITF